MNYIVDERITRYKSGDFIRKFYWNPAAINNDSDVKTGYIVQHIKRQTDDNKGLFSGCDLNHEYVSSRWNHHQKQQNAKGRMTEVCTKPYIGLSMRITRKSLPFFP